MKQLVLILSCLLATMSFQTMAQNGGNITDMEIWMALGGQYEVTDKVDLAIEQQIRFDENASEVKNYHTELEMQFALNKSWDIFGVSRLIRRNDNRGNIQGYENHFRYQAGLSYGHRISQFNLKYRFLFQHQNELGVSENQGDVARMYLRLRSVMQYRIKNWKYDPEIRGEFFKALDEKKAGTTDAFRLGIGTSRNYGKFGDLDFKYYFDRSLKRADNEIVHILSFKYTYSFN